MRDGIPSVNAGGAAGFATVINGVLDNVLGNAPVAGANTTGLGPTGALNAPFAPPATLAGFATSLVGTQASDSAGAGSQLATEQAVQTSLQGQLSGETGVEWMPRCRT